MFAVTFRGNSGVEETNECYLSGIHYEHTNNIISFAMNNITWVVKLLIHNKSQACVGIILDACKSPKE